MNPWAFWALVLMLVGLWIVLRRSAGGSRAGRTRLCPIADAAAHGRVAIGGVVVEAEDGLVEAPFSGRPCVWYHATVEQYQATPFGLDWIPIASARAGRAFQLDDGSGERARVVYSVDEDAAVHDVASSGSDVDAAPISAFLAAHRGTSNELGEVCEPGDTSARRRFRERLLLPGDHVYAIGPCRREPSVNAEAPAPNAPAVVLEAVGPGLDDKVTLQTVSPEAAPGRPRFMLVLAVLVLLVAGAMALFGAPR
jgi:hypothetical protein